jgi:hypothetical protein
MVLNCFRSGVLLPICLLATGPAAAQTPEPPPPPPGQVLTPAEPHTAVPPDARPAVPVTDAERASVEITSIALDLHLTPSASREEAHATVTVHNRGTAAAARIPLQLSSTLHWLSASSATPAGVQPIPFTQSPITTDTDHTGYAQEAVFTPSAPLAPGASVALSVFYGGEIKRSGDRLELIGAPHDRALNTDWDEIAPTSDGSATALRGFGNVLWYPVAAPTAGFGDGNRVFDLIARERQRNTGVTMRLRLTVDYVGDPPDAAIFDGQLQPLAKAPDSDDQVIEQTHGLATADFAISPVGFRTPSLFLTAQRAATTPDQLLTVISPQMGVMEPYATAAANLKPVLAELLGETPRSSLLLLDHAGEPFEDGGLLVAQLSAAAEPKAIAPELMPALTHSWFRSQSPESRVVPASSLWIDQGLPEFMSLIWTERTQGLETAVGELRHAAVLLALADSTPSGNPQPLTSAYADAFLRLKSAFVLWQLRELVGSESFSQSLTAYRHSLALNPAFDRDPKALQTTLEKIGKRDLGWFFDDWVYRDKGLPDLTIVAANPRPLPVRAGRSGGYLVAVDVRNDGDAVADVPVTVRAGTLSATERLRIPGHSSGSTRVVFEGRPETVEVNDGSVPELRGTSHTLTLTVP